MKNSNTSTVIYETEHKLVRVNLKINDGETKQIRGVHHTFPKLLRRLHNRLNVYLVGPAGSGKTHAAKQIAKELELDFSFLSVGAGTRPHEIFGFIHAKGNYVTTEFRKRYENGGVFLLDEIDSCNAGVLTSINAALAGDQAAFPDGMIRKHKDFVCIAAGNTFGTGPDRQYVGRQELDAASIDRFSFLEWGYDLALEREIATAFASDEAQAHEWVDFVQAVRKSIEKLGIRHVVSPRATMNGIKLLASGEDLESTKKSEVWKSLKDADIERILANTKFPEKREEVIEEESDSDDDSEIEHNEIQNDVNSSIKLPTEKQMKFLKKLMKEESPNIIDNKVKAIAGRQLDSKTTRKDYSVAIEHYLKTK